jgi:Histidine-specific methyltransferase, SAM-dependent
MKTEVLLTENEISEEFSDALEARDLPEKFFYWSPHSVAAWTVLSKDPASESYWDSWNQLTNEIARVRRHLGAKAAVVSLGAGNGAKDVELVKALEHEKMEVEYFPVDASASLLEQACSSADDAEIDALGIKADISSPIHLVLAADAAEAPKLFLLTGNTMGGLDPLTQIRYVSEAMHEPDRLLIDAQISNDGAQAMLDNPIHRRFAFAPLASVGLGIDQGELRFEEKHDDRHPGLQLIARSFRAGSDLHVWLPDRDILMERGERINLNFCYSYTPEAFRWLLAGAGKLRILEEAVSADGRAMTALCAR